MTKQFRPYFTYPELQEIVTCLKENPTPARISLLRKLGFFIAKIQNEAVSPQYIPTPRKTLADKLELSDPPSQSTQSPQSPQPNPGILYDKFLNNPSSCTPSELSIIMEYRYTNNLMNQTEESEYEQTILSAK